MRLVHKAASLGIWSKGCCVCQTAGSKRPPVQVITCPSLKICFSYSSWKKPISHCLDTQKWRLLSVCPDIPFVGAPVTSWLSLLLPWTLLPRDLMLVEESGDRKNMIRTTSQGLSMGSRGKSPWSVALLSYNFDSCVIKHTDMMLESGLQEAMSLCIFPNLGPPLLPTSLTCTSSRSRSPFLQQAMNPKPRTTTRKITVNRFPLILHWPGGRVKQECGKCLDLYFENQDLSLSNTLSYLVKLCL